MESFLPEEPGPVLGDGCGDRTGRLDRKFLRRLRPAGWLEGAGLAGGLPCGADEGAEIHQGRVCFPRPSVAKQGKPGLVEERFPLRRGGRNRDEGPAGKDPDDVRIEGHGREAVGKGADGGRRVGPDSGECEKFLLLVGDLPSVSVDHRLGRRMEPAGARVIAKPLPRREDFAFGGLGQRCRIGKELYPSPEFRQDRRDRGLLEHEFGDQDRVG